MLTTMKLYLLLLVSWRAQESRCQEVSTPSSHLRPRNFNHHSLLNEVEPTGQGPVLFPNDAPPPPRPPLIVTSRPLLESIARSELAENNTVTSQSQDRVAFLPFLARVKDYRPYNPSPTFDYQFAPTQVPYADLVKKTRFNGLQRDNRYDDYEEQTVIPPIYKALSDHAKQKVFKIKEKKPSFTPHYQNNDIQEENNSEYDQNQNYAFSYTVKDQKTGDDFSHSQHSSGSATNGEYRVRLPDGRMQIVSYTADENGYKADVRYDEDTGNTIETNNQHNNYDNQHNNYNNKQKYHHNRQNDYIPNEQNNYALKPHSYQPKFYVTPTQQSYVTDKHYVTPVQHNNYEQNDYSDRQVDYTDRSNNYKYDYVDGVTDKKEANDKDRDYYQYPENSDLSKEYYNDYSSEYNSNNEPHKSKFSFAQTKNVATASTVKPSYEELKHLFVTKKAYDTQNNYDPVEIKVPSTTPVPYDGTTEHVVHIGGRNLYTNIKHSLINPTPVPVSYSSPKVVVASTPRSYLVSTIASLKNKVNLVTKPVLSDNYISRINKYINFSNN